MLKNLLMFILLGCSTIVAAQAVKGKVYDEKNQPLYGATIFLDGTSISTISGEDGFFQLPVLSKVNSNLVVSYIGYQTVTISAFTTDKDIEVKMVPSTNSLKEVVIKKNRFTRKEMLKLFREQFLGDTKAGRKAVIVNEDALDFEYDEQYKVFKASSDQPLVIQNPVLGYEVTYEISDFIVEFKTLSIKSIDTYRILFTGVSRFKETASTADVVKERLKSYRGSVLHFFRSLVSNKLAENKFLLVKSKKAASVKDNFQIKDSEGLKEVKLINNPVQIVSKNNLEQPKFYSFYQISFDSSKTSGVTFLTPTFNIDAFGIHSHVNQILFEGDMSDKRVGDLLPTNYGVEE